MNYRHQFHAGNFADVMKHVLLLQLVRAQQRKPKGFVFLDTHAGRGRYDLTAAARGDTLERRPEWPEGIGRLWQAELRDPLLRDYVQQVKAFAPDAPTDVPLVYPGSPLLAAALLRPVDRAVLCEKQPDEYLALCSEFHRRPKISVQETDGYTAIRATLPSLERRALVLIDPPFEDQDEFARIAGGLRDGLARLENAVFAVWYPLTERARIDVFFTELRSMQLPPTLACELTVAGPASPLRMRGCGLLVLNPPWQFQAAVEPALNELSERLAQAPGGEARLEWLVPET